MCNLQVNNVFDRAYQSHLSRLKYFEPQETINTGYRGIYNMGRNFALKLVFSYQFERVDVDSESGYMKNQMTLPRPYIQGNTFM